MENNSPKIGITYKGFVASIDRLGYQIRLLEFQEVYEGLLHKNISFNQDTNKLICGRCVKVTVTAICDKFIVISLDSIEEEMIYEKNETKKRDDETSRVIRISSPDRYQVKQLSGTFSSVNIKLKEDPIYFKMMKLSIGCSDTIQGGLFTSVVTIPEGFMLSNAIRMRSEQFADFASFLNSSHPGLDMHKGWITDICEPSKSNMPTPLQVAENPIEIWGSKKSASNIKKQRELLPIFKVRNDLIRAVLENRFLIVQGETGSGKSTQIPQYLLESGFAKEGKIVCTQPRKIATMSLAKRVAEEQGYALGAEVGYKYRFCDKTSSATLIKYCTEGTLLRECLNASHLNNYSVIILDEAHERTTNTDVLFGFLKKEMRERSNLRVIVSSATMEAEKFSRFFCNAPIFNIEGRTFSVEMFYRTVNISDYFNASLATAIYIHATFPKPGDILLFFTGQEEIDHACDVLENHSRSIPDLVVLPIYSALQYSEQVKVFNSVAKGFRKLVISTNVAETSMTIPGIYYVIDAGYTKLKMYEPKSGLEVLQIMPISQASADQRAGRAGRTGPGKCFRLYTKDSYKKLIKTSIPEIQRSNLTSVILQFKAMNINEITNFEFMDKPSKEVLFMSEKQLYMLNALDHNGYITDMGRRMVDMPLEPNESKMLIMSIDMGCSDEVLTIIAMLSIQNVFFRPRRKHVLADTKKAAMQSSISDLITLLNVYNTWKLNNYSSKWCSENFISERSLNEAYDVRRLLVEKMDQNRFEIVSCGKNYERIQKAICAGLVLNIAKKTAKGFKYITIQDSGEAYIHPSSALMKSNPQWLCYHLLTETKKKYMREVTIIDPVWLQNFASSIYKF